MKYLNGQPELEILGAPKTVRMRGRWTLANGEIVDLEGPTECWISALVYALSPEQKAVFVTQFKRMLELRDHQLGIGKARVVAEIEMPNIGAKP